MPLQMLSPIVTLTPGNYWVRLALDWLYRLVRTAPATMPSHVTAHCA